MASFLKQLETVYKSVYKMEKYTKPKIYKGGKKNGRWYVYYYYEHPTNVNKEGKPLMQRFNCPTLGINRKYKKKSDRLKHFSVLRNSVESLLKQGYTPFKDNSIEEEEIYNAKNCIKYALEVKSSVVSKKTIDDYTSRANGFIRFLKKRGFAHEDIKQINRKLIVQFLNEVAKKSSASNRNNYRSALSAIFSVLEDEEYVDKNYFSTIKNIKTTPKAHKIYTSKQIETIFKELEKEPILSLYIKLVSYNFLRPVECCRLQVKDIDIENAVLTVNSKTKKGKRKRIPKVLLDELKQKDLSNPNAFLITNDGIAESKLTPEQRRETFSNKYKKIRDKLGYSKDYDVYSFRHYFITKMYRELHKIYTHSVAMDTLQQITGHSTIQALMKYLRTIDANLADDYSHLLK